MLGLDLTIQNDDIVDVGGDFYVKTPKALKRLLQELKAVGYEIKDNRNDEYNIKKGVTVEKMEKNGWSLWYAHLADIRFGLCGHCNQLISTSGILMHGHTCEKCGGITYLEVVDGSMFRFVFNNDGERGMFSPQLNMKVKRWDTENGYLYLYYDFQEGGGFSTVTGENALAYLGRNKEKWEKVSEGGQDFLRIKYQKPWNRDTAMIEPYDTWGHEWHHKIVKVWKDKQYDEYEHLPIPESISIYESWHWAPLSVTANIHSKILSAVHQTDDQGWHYQNGSPWFRSGHWKEMAKFVRHFTSLDADAFDLAWPSFRADGPGGIADIARFCHPASQVRNVPNIGNVLMAIGKGLDGEPLTQQEIQAAKDGLSDPLVKKVFHRK